MKSLWSNRCDCWLLLVLAAVICVVAAPAFAAETLKETAWRYTVRKPADSWQQPGFDDSGWSEGFGGFGTQSTPGARVGTEWGTNNIWLRRQFDLKTVPKNPALLIHHDEDAEVYLNGQGVAVLEGFLREYHVIPLNAAGRKALQAGKNLLAVHCRQTAGGQFIDVHVVDGDNVPKLPGPKRREEPFKSALITKWGAQVTPDNAWQEYPRPQLVRENWQNLNGQWDYAVTPIEQTAEPTKWDGKILVPFCLESKLGGVQRLLHDDQALWYHRTVKLQTMPGKWVKLNFEAVDYRCKVWLNGKPIGGHVGGNTPFSLDATDAAQDGVNELVVRVEDATGGAQLRGKQVLDPHGIRYTRVSGIWQTVWLEQVPERCIADLKISTNAEKGTITVRTKLPGKATTGEKIRLVVRDGKQTVGETEAAELTLTATIPNAKLWSPDSPHLYDLQVSLLDGDGKVIDEVRSYAGIRDVGKVRDRNGHLRFTLNGKEIFHWGPLDQGWWPDGLLTPPSDAALRYDVEFLKQAGFNMIRKHIKVEPRRFYYHCDQLGIMLWQDQPSAWLNPRWTRMAPNPVDAEWSDADHEQYMAELEEMIAALENNPCIVVWVPFNEAWGQHRSMKVGRWTVQRDPSRLVNIASGGNFWPVGHIADAHKYPDPGFPFDSQHYEDFIKVVGEFGGHGFPIAGHLWDVNKRNWGYGGLPEKKAEYLDRYRKSLAMLVELKKQGIAAGVYTQTTDVEGEINGLMTYDRKVIKIPAAELKELSRALFDE